MKRFENMVIKPRSKKASRLDLPDKYLPKNIVIDFMTIDTESMDYLVLLSNNWKKYLPKVIIVEDGNFSFENFSKSKIYQLLLEKGYNLIAKTDVSLIFIH